MSKRLIKVFAFIILLAAVVMFIPAKPVYAGTGDTGFYIYYNPHIYGMKMTVSTMTEFELKMGTPARDMHLYTPSFHVPGDSCLEATIENSRSAGNPSTTHRLAIYDYCNLQWKALIVMDATFKAAYERLITTYPGLAFQSPNVTDKMLTIRTYRYDNAGNCWQTQLWNYTTSHWDQKAWACGHDQAPWGDLGWLILESYGYEQASSTDMCIDGAGHGLGTYGVVQARNVGVYRDDLPPGFQLTPLTMADHEYTFNTHPCVANNSWAFCQDQIQGQWAGDDWIVDDNYFYRYCEF